MSGMQAEPFGQIFGSGGAVSDQDVVGVVIGQPIRRFGARPVVTQSHSRAHRYPESLMPKAGVRVDGFTVTLDVVHADEPEAASISRQVFEVIVDGVEDLIRGFDADAAGVHQELRHKNSPSFDRPLLQERGDVGDGPAGTGPSEVPSVGAAADTSPVPSSGGRVSDERARDCGCLA